MGDIHDLPRVSGNVDRMIKLGAQAPDIDGYLSIEGWTPDAFRAANLQRTRYPWEGGAAIVAGADRGLAPPDVAFAVPSPTLW